MADFASILNRPVDSAEKPKPLPAGEYMLLINKREFGESMQKKTPYVRFHFTIQAPGPDVALDKLAGIDLNKKSLRSDFYLTDDSLYRLRKFLEEDLKLPSSGRPFASLIEETVGKNVVASVIQSPSQKPGDDTIYNEINSFRSA